MLTVLHAPLHGATATRADISRALRYEADSVGFTEGYQQIRAMRRRVHYRLTVGHSPTDTRRGAKDTPILTRRRWERLTSGAVKACEASEPVRLAPERWITYSGYAHPNAKIVHINFHPHANIQGRAWELDRVKKYAESMLVLEELCHTFLHQHYRVIVTGDLNYPAGDPHVRWSPTSVFNRLGFDTWSRGLDWVAWSNGLDLVKRTVIPPDVNGQDHPWLLAGFVAHR